jgi:hypothetical protein
MIASASKERHGLTRSIARSSVARENQRRDLDDPPRWSTLFIHRRGVQRR